MQTDTRPAVGRLRYGGLLLRIKTPGESDGDCGVGAGSSAGQFLPEVA